MNLAAARFGPHEEREIAPVLVDREARSARPAEAHVPPGLSGQRRRHPAGAVDGRVDPVRELLPAGRVEAAWRRARGRRGHGEDEQREQGEQAPHCGTGYSR